MASCSHRCSQQHFINLHSGEEKRNPAAHNAISVIALSNLMTKNLHWGIIASQVKQAIISIMKS